MLEECSLGECFKPNLRKMAASSFPGSVLVLAVEIKCMERKASQCAFCCVLKMIRCVPNVNLLLLL